MMVNDYGVFKQAIEEERFRCERLEEQINDLTELHQHEVTNIKQVGDSPFRTWDTYRI